MKNKILILISPSSCGKDYIARKLISDHNFNPLISHTTRPIRPKEKNGQDYYFVSDAQFKPI